MSTPYRRTVTYDQWWQLIVEFTDVKKAHEQIMLMFEYQDIAMDKDEDIEEEFLKLLASTFIAKSTDWLLEGVKDCINDMDGFCPMNNEYGMLIVHVDEWVFEQEEFSVSKAEVQS